MQRLAALLLLGSLLFNVGCAGFMQYREETTARREQKSQMDWADQNWKGGYGFNNRNPDRIRNGLEPVNFDGSLDSEDDDGYFSQLFGDLLAYGFKSGFSAIVNSLRR